jgi:hypothetical protein
MNNYIVKILIAVALLSFNAAAQLEGISDEPAQKYNGTVLLSAGTTKKLTGIVGRGKPHFYKVKPSQNLRITVNSDGKAGFAVDTIVFLELEHRESFGDDVFAEESYLATPTERIYELEKNKDYELVVLNRGKGQIPFNFTIKAEPSRYKEYTFEACGRKNKVRADLVTLRNKQTLGRSDLNFGGVNDNYVFGLELLADADLDRDGKTEKLVLAECSNDFEAEMNDYPRTYILYAFDLSKNSALPIDSHIINLKSNEVFNPEKMEFKCDVISISFNNIENDEKKKKIYKLNWIKSKFVNFNDKRLQDKKKENSFVLSEPDRKKTVESVINKKQTIKKANIVFEVPNNWKLAQENENAISIAPPGQFTLIEKTVENFKQDKMSLQQTLAMIKKTPGVKQE